MYKVEFMHKRKMIAAKRIIKEVNVLKSRLKAKNEEILDHDLMLWRRDRIFVLAVCDAIGGVIGNREIHNLETKISFASIKARPGHESMKFKTMSGSINIPIRQHILVDRKYLTITVNIEDFMVLGTSQKLDFLTQIIFDKIYKDGKKYKKDATYRHYYHNYMNQVMVYAIKAYINFRDALETIEAADTQAAARKRFLEW